MTQNENHIIQNFINGTLDEATRLKLSKKITNPKSSEEKNTMKNNSQKFDADAAWKTLHNKLKEDNLIIPENKKRNNSFYKISRIAASIIIFTGLSISGYFIVNSNSDINIQSENSLKEIRLPDGSEITLNTKSHLSYPKKFARNNRLIKFEGEAFFKIAKNPEKPFIIKTKNSQIKVLGTSFNVNTDKNKTEVIVKTGKVEFKSASNGKAKLVLIQGEKGVLHTGKLYKTKNDNPNYLAWKTRIFTYENTKLKTIVSDINKAYNVNIRFENPEIGEIITGKTTFNNYDIETVIKIICETHRLKADIKGKNITLSY